MGRRFTTQPRGLSHPNEDGSSRLEALERCTPDEELHLVPDPENPFDNSAVAVFRTNGEQLGYLPAHTDFTKALSAGGLYKVTLGRVMYHRGFPVVEIEIETIRPAPRNAAMTGMMVLRKADEQKQKGVGCFVILVAAALVVVALKAC